MAGRARRAYRGAKKAARKTQHAYQKARKAKRRLTKPVKPFRYHV